MVKDKLHKVGDATEDSHSH